MEGLGEEIEHFQGIEPVALLEQEPEVAGQRRRVTGNVVKAFGAQRHEQLERRDPGARAGRVHYYAIRFCLRAAPQEIERHLGHGSNVRAWRRVRVPGCRRSRTYANVDIALSIVFSR